MSIPSDRQWIKRLYQKHRLAIVVGQALLFVLVGYFIASGIGGSGRGGPELANDRARSTAVNEGPSMWTCSMHPQIRSATPGDCPICGMDLIPVAKTSGGLRTLSVSPAARALMSIATTPVERRYVSHEIPMVGKVDFDETKMRYITAWVPGRLDRLYVDYTGVSVNKGDHMAYIYSPELYSSQEELIQALKYRRERPSTTQLPSIDLVEAAREKLRLLGLTEEQIGEIEKQSKPTDHLTIYSPVDGVVIEKLKQEGDYVQTGERLYTVADLTQVWVHLDAYESDLPWLTYGQDLTITTEAYPGDEFHGRIAFIQPVLNDKTRTVKIRVNVPNPVGKLKPEMFVHAVVKPRVAAGGRVMDPSLAGKWISPMHPEIVKEGPGTCDICGMPLVRAESLGFVTPETDDKQAPLVIPYSAALVTGRRAVVYVELPVMPDGVDTAFQGIGAAIEAGNMDQIHQAFAVLSNVLDRPYGDSGSDYARNLWNRYADRLAEHALTGRRAKSKDEASAAFAQLEAMMTELREEFGPIGQPTFEGREIVLGPRAGDFYLVSHGLQAGEEVVTQGNFKIDAEIQIQAKPSMMTPEGGGGGGHHHGGDDTTKISNQDHTSHQTTLPSTFNDQIGNLQAAYEQIQQAVEEEDLGHATAAFEQFANVLDAVDGSELTGHARMQWREFKMLLSNDAFEGRHAEQPSEVDRLFLSLKGHMRRMREQLAIQTNSQPHVERIEAPPQFQSELAAVWEKYLAIQKELAGDQFDNAKELLPSLETAVSTVDDSTLAGRAQQIWEREKANLSKLVERLDQVQDIKSMRAEFKPLSEEIGVLAKAFGFGEAGPIYELHCPMAFQNKGAIWYQENDQVRNPYYGMSMPTCADRVEEVVRDKPTDREIHESHSQ